MNNLNLQSIYDWEWRITTALIIFLMAAVLGMAYSESTKATKEQIGYTKQELKEMKNLCEKDLPRSEECVIVVTYKANNKQGNDK